MGRPHKKLDAWQQAIQLTEQVYRVTATFPVDEKYGLTSQMRRAAVSIPSNIAEGAARSTDREKAQFYIVARGSASELDTQVEIARRLAYSTENALRHLDAKVSRVSALLQGLIDRCKNGIAGS